MLQEGGGHTHTSSSAHWLSVVGVDPYTHTAAAATAVAGGHTVDVSHVCWYAGELTETCNTDTVCPPVCLTGFSQHNVSSITWWSRLLHTMASCRISYSDMFHCYTTAALRTILPEILLLHSDLAPSTTTILTSVISHGLPCTILDTVWNQQSWGRDRHLLLFCHH